MPRFKLDRRTFLNGVGVSMALPMLDAMEGVGHQASAAVNGGAPKRMVNIITDLGLETEGFFPKQDGKNYQLPKLLKPMEGLKKDISIFSNIDHPHIALGHRAVASFLSGVKLSDSAQFKEKNITIDQKAAQMIGDQTRYRFMALNLANQIGTGSMSWSSTGVAIPYISNPQDAFNALFAPDSREQRTKRRNVIDSNRSVMDVIMQQARQLQKKLGYEDKQKLGEYFESVRSVEMKLQQERAWVDKPKPKVRMKRPTLKNDLNALPVYLELIALALETDSTRVANMRIPGGGFKIGLEGVRGGYHSISHHGKKQKTIEMLHKIELYYTQEVAKFIKRLKSKREGGRPMLDSTMVMLGSPLGNANSHSNRNVPIMLAGGGFKHGQHHRLPRKGRTSTPLCNLYLTMLQQFGMEEDSFGTSTGTIDVI